MKNIFRNILFLFKLTIIGFQFTSLQASDSNAEILHLNISGAIGPASADYFIRSLNNRSKKTELIILQLDTPGGLDTSMREIIKSITRSSIPVVCFVSPGGARAASAGTFILYASHISAMSPGTNIGAATPVQIGGVSPPKLPKTDQYPDKEKPTPDEQVTDVKEQKIMNDAAAFIRSLAELHGRNKEWAELAVRESASLTAKEALKLNVIDIVAKDLNDLLLQLQGRTVNIQNVSRILHTEGMTIIKLDPDWRSRILSIITNPNIAYILMLVGIYGLIFEFSNPGAILPGTAGVISLVLALYSFHLLPINYAGLALVLLGLALMVAEIFQPSFGVLGIGGIVSFVFGSIILMDTKAPGFGIDRTVIISFTLCSAFILFFIIKLALKARQRPIVSGLEELIGAKAIVVHDFCGQGTVRMHSETWNARSNTELKEGESVIVKKIDGLTLEVEPILSSLQEKK